MLSNGQLRWASATQLDGPARAPAVTLPTASGSVWYPSNSTRIIKCQRIIEFWRAKARVQK